MRVPLMLFNWKFRGVKGAQDFAHVNLKTVILYIILRGGMLNKFFMTECINMRIRITNEKSLIQSYTYNYYLCV